MRGGGRELGGDGQVTLAGVGGVSGMNAWRWVSFGCW